METKESILSQLKQISEIPDNWDGYGAITPCPEIISQAEKLISILDENIISKISDITPNPYGTISIDWENENTKNLLSLEIGLTKCGYFIRNSHKCLDEADLFGSLEAIKADILSIY